jgi:hypothetical protein
MYEHRRLPRKKVDEPLEVFDPVTNTSLGSLVNITVGGFLLYSKTTITIGSIHQLVMPLPRTIDNYDKVSFGAEAVWSSTLEETKSNWSGFHIIDISDRERDVIGKLIEDWEYCDR